MQQGPNRCQSYAKDGAVLHSTEGHTWRVMSSLIPGFKPWVEVSQGQDVAKEIEI